ncbi:hypothetical protein QLX08_006731 [Tetragonisca angustula]|uniref:Uncharacterized protein n=1 Tax=Tetragonisca angustula TaxID=166442 RepID=A0AAW0ZTE2_9HYME
MDSPLARGTGPEGRKRQAGGTTGAGPRSWHSADDLGRFSQVCAKSPKTRLRRSSDRCGLQKSPQMISET